MFTHFLGEVDKGFVKCAYLKGKIGVKMEGTITFVFKAER